MQRKFIQYVRLPWSYLKSITEERITLLEVYLLLRSWIFLGSLRRNNNCCKFWGILRKAFRDMFYSNDDLMWSWPTKAGKQCKLRYWVVNLWIYFMLLHYMFWGSSHLKDFCIINSINVFIMYLLWLYFINILLFYNILFVFQLQVGIRGEQETAEVAWGRRIPISWFP